MILTWLFTVFALIVVLDLVYHAPSKKAPEPANPIARKDSMAGETADPMPTLQIETWRDVPPAPPKTKPDSTLGEIEEIAAWLAFSARAHQLGMISRDRLLDSTTAMASRLAAAQQQSKSKTLRDAA